MSSKPKFTSLSFLQPLNALSPILDILESKPLIFFKFAQFKNALEPIDPVTSTVVLTFVYSILSKQSHPANAFSPMLIGEGTVIEDIASQS